MSALTVAEAEAAWAELRSHLTNVDRAVRRIIETRAWEPLGYGTFAEAWADRMRGVRLASTIAQAFAVYALIDDGLDKKAALDALGSESGVASARFDALARQREAGVPPELASTRVRSHLRQAPAAAHVVHVILTADEYAHYKAALDARGLDLANEAGKALRAHLRRLERVGAA